MRYLFYARFAGLKFLKHDISSSKGRRYYEDMIPDNFSEAGKVKNAVLRIPRHISRQSQIYPHEENISPVRHLPISHFRHNAFAICASGGEIIPLHRRARLRGGFYGLCRPLKYRFWLMIDWCDAIAESMMRYRRYRKETAPQKYEAFFSSLVGDEKPLISLLISRWFWWFSLRRWRFSRPTKLSTADTPDGDKWMLRHIGHEKESIFITTWLLMTYRFRKVMFHLLLPELPIRFHTFSSQYRR